MNKQRTIIIPEAEVEMMQAFLQGKGHGSDGTIKTYTADFGDGIEADIKVCDADRESTPFVDAVLFDHGSQVDVLEVADDLIGEYIFTYNDYTYTVIVEIPRKTKSVSENKKG